ncbi:sensor histidine kinase [Haloarchaeobius sp. TZWWS8]|uniref:sensor histidine kinase n=1 Tax=Haloarchaeobius sp. TZWWS8 TaxID=3446121 RepID=UPI003EBE22B8
MSRQWLDRYPWSPIAVYGFLVVGFSLLHLFSHGPIHPPLVAESALLALLGSAILYGSWRLTRLELDAVRAVSVFSTTIAFGVVGLVVAAVLAAMQQVQGAGIVHFPALLIGGSSATAAIGIAVAEFREHLLSERAKLEHKKIAVEQLNDRLTVLNRVLRHNLRNEITLIRGLAQTGVGTTTDSEIREALETIDEQATKIARLSENAKRLKQLWEEDDTTRLDLAAIARESVEVVQRDYPDATIEVNVPETATVSGHFRLGFGVTEAIRNAVRHTDPSTRVQVDVTNLSDGSVEVRIVDSGAGIPADELEPLELRAEDQLTHGSGLGLWLVYWSVERSGGELTFEEREPQGTVVRMRFPPA